MRFKIDWASLILGRKFTVFLCFTLYLRAISKYKPPGGLIFGGAFLRRGFCVRSLGGLYLEGLIFGILRVFRCTCNRISISTVSGFHLNSYYKGQNTYSFGQGSSSLKSVSAIEMPKSYPPKKC